MKNLQKGFIVPLLIAVISLLVMGGGVAYFTTKTPTSSQNIGENNYQPQENQNSVSNIPIQNTVTNNTTNQQIQNGNPSSSPTDEPTITVLSPNGGEKFNFYEPIEIKWKNNRINEPGFTAIYLCKVDPLLHTLLTKNIIQNTFCLSMEIVRSHEDINGINSVIWKAGTVNDGIVVPMSFGNYGVKALPASGGNYRIKIVNYFGEDKSSMDYLSNTFKIEGDVSPKVDLKINGSDGPVKVKLGDKVEVTWSSNGAEKCMASGEGWAERDLNGKYIIPDIDTPLGWFYSKTLFGSQTSIITTSASGYNYELLCINSEKQMTLDNVFINSEP